MPSCEQSNCPINWNGYHEKCPFKKNGQCTNFEGEKLFEVNGSLTTAFKLIWNAMNVLLNVEDWLEEIPEEKRDPLYDHPILKHYDLLP